jgi:hypothetical protein
VTAKWTTENLNWATFISVHKGREKELHLRSEIVITGSGRIMDNPLMISSESSTANGTEEYKHSIHTYIHQQSLNFSNNAEALISYEHCNKQNKIPAYPSPIT